MKTKSYLLIALSALLLSACGSSHYAGDNYYTWNNYPKDDRKYYKSESEYSGNQDYSDDYYNRSYNEYNYYSDYSSNNRTKPEVRYVPVVVPWWSPYSYSYYEPVYYYPGYYFSISFGRPYYYYHYHYYPHYAYYNPYRYYWWDDYYYWHRHGYYPYHHYGNYWGYYGCYDDYWYRHNYYRNRGYSNRNRNTYEGRVFGSSRGYDRYDDRNYTPDVRRGGRNAGGQASNSNQRDNIRANELNLDNNIFSPNERGNRTNLRDIKRNSSFDQPIDGGRGNANGRGSRSGNPLFDERPSKQEAVPSNDVRQRGREIRQGEMEAPAGNTNRDGNFRGEGNSRGNRNTKPLFDERPSKQEAVPSNDVRQSGREIRKGDMEAPAGRSNSGSVSTPDRQNRSRESLFESPTREERSREVRGSIPSSGRGSYSSPSSSGSSSSRSSRSGSYSSPSSSSSGSSRSSGSYSSPSSSGSSSSGSSSSGSSSSGSSSSGSSSGRGGRTGGRY